MNSRRVKLTFPPDLIREPVMAQLVRRYDVVPNIRRADVNEDVGWLVCEIEGDESALDAALAWLAETGVDIDYLEHPLEG